MQSKKELKTLRKKRNLTVRDVEQATRRIAEAKGDRRFSISNGWLAQLEHGISEPSICKLFSLCAAYRASFKELARLYNVDLEEIEKYAFIASPHLTQLSPEPHDARTQGWEGGATAFTSLIPRLVSASEAEPQDGRNILYGYIGLTDYTMYPLIRPGARVEIDSSQNKFQLGSRQNEFERPIFFIELREGYACGWCELQDQQLLIIPHHQSPATVRSFSYPKEAEIVGRVVGYHTSCVDGKKASQ